MFMGRSFRHRIGIGDFYPHMNFAHDADATGETHPTAPSHDMPTLPADWLPAGIGAMGEYIRAVDWAATPLGAPAGWPQSLKTAVRILLTSRFAMWMGWGPDLTFLYNEAYATRTLGKKHPWGLGKPAREVWAEVWDDIKSRVRTVLDTGTATWDEALQLFLERNGYTEETYHTFSYSPLTDETGAVAGMLCVVVEETDRVIGERQLATLRELSGALAATTTEHEVLEAVERTLRANQLDLPFSLAYLFENNATQARLVSHIGIDATHAIAPAVIETNDAAAPWLVAELLKGRTRTIVETLSNNGAPIPALPRGAWQTPPRAAAIVPIAQQAQEQPAGFLVAGLNPYRLFDTEYSGFLELIAGQIAASLANARAYEAEKQRAESLAELDRAKTVFFSNVSHEFRTPLTLLLSPTEDALADPATAVENRERLGLIHRNALRLLKLVNTLLDFSRIEAGRIQATYEPTALSAYTAELASNFRSALERAGLQLVVDTPVLSKPVYIDRDMWEKIVLNLLSNAFKHTFEGTVTVRVVPLKGSVALEVQDTGIGIPPEQLPYIFERFHRVPHARSRTHEGTGIGLALVQELVKLHGGTMHVESTVGQGTTFRVIIPLGSAHLPADHVGTSNTRATGGGAAAFVEEALHWLPNTESSTKITQDFASPEIHDDAPFDDFSDSPSLGNIRVLVADDNVDMRDYLVRILHQRGLTVDVVSNGREALEAARAHHPTLILSDMMMPELDGFGLIRELRADESTRTIPVMLLSARAGEEAHIEGIQAGADDYLVKPFLARELLARVDAQLRRAQARAEEQRKQEEQERLLTAVRAERAKLQDLFAQAPAAIAVLRGPEHVYEIANAHYMLLVGERDILGKPIRTALPELEGQGIFEILDNVYATGVPFIGSALRLMLDSDGDGVPEEHFFNFVYQPIHERNYSVSAIFVHAVDVTEQIQARREAESARVAAETANRAKSEFLAAMSHELRTPLNAIAGHAQLMEMGLHGPVSPEQREALTRIQRSEAHLLALINDVLNFAKLEAGRVEYHIEAVPLLEVVSEVLPMLAPQLAAKDLHTDVNVAPEVIVRADREKVQQILINLLSNAMKFTDSGGRVSIVTSSVPGNTSLLASKNSGKLVSLLVSDTGIGIPPEKQEEIFDPFVQVHRNLTQPIEGTGLGLAISRDLARAMGGDLTVQSEPGVGSAFTLTLPVMEQ